MPDLRGNNEAPPLTGADFMTAWSTRQARELLEFIQGAMPPAGARLPADQYLAITACILQANGGRAGAQPLAATAATPIGVIATGQGQNAPLPQRLRQQQPSLPHKLKAVHNGQLPA